MNMEAKVKATLVVGFFLISMLVVGMVSYEAGQRNGYERGYAEADQDWQDYLNEVWGPFVDMVYREGYADGYSDGYLWGFVEAWNEYGAGETFQYPRDGLVP